MNGFCKNLIMTRKTAYYYKIARMEFAIHESSMSTAGKKLCCY